MEILVGLFSGMVLQRNKKNVCDVTIQGRTDASGPVILSVSKGSKKLAGYNDLVIGQAARGSLKAELQGLPVGGPYRIELSVTDVKTNKPDRYVASDVLVGDVWISGGQSNMQGIGLLSGAEKPDPMVRAFYMDDHWAVAKDPIHQLHLAVDDFHRLSVGEPLKNNPTGTGPAIAFAQAMHEATGVPQGILASAHGGTSLLQWDPDKKSMGGQSLYGAMFRRFVKNGSAVAGMIWYQGENETNPQDYPHFTTRMKKLIGASRRDLKFPAMPWVMVQLGRTVGSVGDPNQWNDIQEQQRKLPQVINHVAVVPAIDLTLDDQIHISGVGCRTLGRRMAQAMRVLLGDRKAGLPPIELKSIQVRPVKYREQCEIVVDFANVQGKLQCPGRPTGFSVTDASGRSEILFETELSGHQAILRCSIPPRMLLGDRFVRYGAGFNPVCQITDQAGRSLPVFGPMIVGKPRAVTGFTTLCQVSDILPSAGKLHELKYPKDQSGMNWTVRTFLPNFTHRHEELMALAPKDVLVWYRAPLKLSEPMVLKALMGYDGPIKVFFDGREVFFDPHGTNPAIMDKVAVPLGKLAAGEHEVLVAMGSNGGLAWGTFLRFERMDLSIKRILQGLTREELPQVNL